MKYFTFNLLIISLTGCANALVFESIRNSQKLQCEELPSAEREECLKTLDESYEEYKQKRDEAIESS